MWLQRRSHISPQDDHDRCFQSWSKHVLQAHVVDCLSTALAFGLCSAKNHNTVMSKRSITIAVDFGTTYSGCCWSFGSHDINPIRVWPGKIGQFDKVPTVLYYDPHSPAEPVSWGYDESNAATKIEWFKLFLGATDLEPLPFGLTPEHVITKYLSLFRMHCEHEIVAGLSGSIPLPIWNANKHNIQYVLTVPANWDERANNIMQSCFRNAGYIINSPDQLRLVTEPEAAANYYAREQREYFDWQTGDHLMIIDAGGGTVDVILYVVRSAQPFIVDEAVRGEAGFCGATYLDLGFREWMDCKCARLSPDMHRESATIKRNASSQWEAWKTGYDGTDESNIRMRVLAESVVLPDCDIINGTLMISPQDMRNIFDPVCGDIMALINSQLDRLYASSYFTPGRTRLFPLLVGGFGQSRYLNHVLRNQLRRDFSDNIGRLPDCWRAVVCGALVCGQAAAGGGVQEIVGAHIARRHYLMRCHVNYDPRLHNGSPLPIRTDAQTGETTCETTHVFCRIGQSIKLNGYFEQRFTRSVLEGQEMIFRTLLFDSDAPQGPPIMIDGQCRQLCVLEADFRSVPFGMFQKVQLGKGIFNKRYRYILNYHLRLMVGSGTMQLELWFMGRKMGQNTAKIEYL